MTPKSLPAIAAQTHLLLSRMRKGHIRRRLGALTVTVARDRRLWTLTIKRAGRAPTIADVESIGVAFGVPAHARWQWPHGTYSTVAMWLDGSLSERKEEHVYARSD